MVLAGEGRNGKTVAPFAGAWVETCHAPTVGRSARSLPSRERGLKLGQTDTFWALLGSLPSRERGLKQHQRFVAFVESQVAPFAGAWVETISRIMSR